MPSCRAEVWWAIDRIEEATLRGDPFHAADAARELGMTADHLGRLFKEATGRTLVSYYKHRRVQYAQRLLLGPRMSITDVALAAGYCDAAHFCKQFKQLTGITPTAYRARYLGPPWPAAPESPVSSPRRGSRRPVAAAPRCRRHRLPPFRLADAGAVAPWRLPHGAGGTDDISPALQCGVGRHLDSASRRDAMTVGRRDSPSVFCHTVPTGRRLSAPHTPH